MDFKTLDSWCEKGIWGLVLAILVLGPLTAGASPGSEFSIISERWFLITQGLTIVVIALWAARFWLQQKNRLLWPPVCWAVAVFTGYAIYRYQTADLEYIARGELLRILVYAFLFLAILDNLHKQEATTSIVFVLLFLGMSISLYAVYQFITKSNHVGFYGQHEQYLGRGGGTYINPNHLAGFLEMLLPIGLACTLTGRSTAVTKVFLGYASIVIFAGVVVTLSRGGWIATGLALTLFFGFLVRYRETRWLSLLFFVLLISTAGYLWQYGPKFKGRWKAMVQETGGIDDVRFYLWKPAVQLWKTDPWRGIGPGHFDYRFPSVRPEIVQNRPGRVHNDYLNTLTDWGVIGAGLVAGAFGLIFMGVFKTWKFVRRTSDLGTKPSNRSAIVLGTTVGLLAILFHSALDFNMNIPANAVIAVALMALLTGFVRFATERHWAPLSILLRLVLTALCITAIAYLGKQEVRRIREYVLLRRADSEGTAIKRKNEALGSTPLLSATEIRQVSSFIAKINLRSDGISRHLFDRFSADSPGLLVATDPSIPELVNELNRIISGPPFSLFEATQRDGVSPFSVLMSPGAKELLAKQPAGPDLLLLNRVLLEEAYPMEIAPNPSWRECGRPGTTIAEAKGILAGQIQTKSERQLTALREAHEVEPANFEITYQIGELLRLSAWHRPGSDPVAYENAIPWFQKGIQLNPYDPYNYLRHGMCLSRLKRPDEAKQEIQKAVERDPKNYFIVAHMGWFYLTVENYAEAKRWFLESKRLSEWRSNQIAYDYLAIIAEHEKSIPKVLSP